MDWNKAERRHDPTSVEGRIHKGLKDLLWARKSCSLLHSFSAVSPIWTDNEQVWAVCRRRPEGTALFLANFSEDWQSVDVGIIANGGLSGQVRDLLATETNLNASEGRLYLAPYQSLVLIGDE
jgi:amylosucrase